MTHWKALLKPCAASSLALAVLPGVAHAQPACRIGHAVRLEIQLEPAERSTLDQLQRRLAAELRARDLDVCPLAAGQHSRAQVYVLAPLPDLSPTLVRVQTAGGARLERDLNVAALPREARPSAIASATDELLAVLLESAPAAATGSAERAPEGRNAAPPSPAQEPRWKPPALELGLGGSGALFERDGQAYGAELLARWRPLSRLFSTVRLGGDRGSARSPWLTATDAPGLAPNDLSHGWHAGLDVGLELLEPAQGFGVAASGGLTLASVHRTTQALIPLPDGSSAQRLPLGSSWELAASAGGELSYHTGPWGISLALAVLVPLTPPRSTPLQELPLSGLEGMQWDAWSGGPAPPGQGLGEQLGGQLDLRLWVALSS